MKKGAMLGIGCIVGLIIVGVAAYFYPETTLNTPAGAKDEKSASVAIVVDKKKAAASSTSTVPSEENKEGTGSAQTTKATPAATISGTSETEEVSTSKTPGTALEIGKVFFFWSFNSRTRAEGFKNDLENKTGITLLITDVSEDKCDVGFTYSDEADRAGKIQKIERAGGIKVQR